MNQISTKTEWVTKLVDSYMKWVATTEISRPLPHSMLLLNDSHQVYLDFITSVDFLGTIYKTYKDLITTDLANQLGYMANCDIILGKVRKGFKTPETFVISIISGQLEVSLLHCIQKIIHIRLFWKKIVQNTSYQLRHLK